MTEYQYTAQRIKDLLNILSQENLPSQYRSNQETALEFYVTQIRKLRRDM